MVTSRSKEKRKENAKVN